MAADDDSMADLGEEFAAADDGEHLDDDVAAADVGDYSEGSSYHSDSDGEEQEAGEEEIAGEEQIADESTAEQGPPVVVPCPEVGMIFEHADLIRNFYARYAHSKGFSIMSQGIEKRNNSPLDFNYVRYYCGKSGVYNPKCKNVKRLKKSRKEDCKAHINCWRDKSGEFWRITLFNDEHNHRMDRKNSRFMPNHRNINIGDDRKITSMLKVGVPLSKVYATIANDYDGIDKVPFTERDARNRANKIRRLQLEGGDFVAFQRYQDAMARDSPNFYRATQYCEEGRAVNIFWCDGRAREAYKDFGDVISFDATYMKNKYKMPFCPFIGVNHHGQSIILGYALIGGESTRNYIWVFKQFLNCMGGIPPMGIVTDQCPGMEKAIQHVFKGTGHRRCLFHIMQNAEKHLKKRYKEDWDEIEKRMKNVMHNSLSIGHFQEKWEEMLNEFDLQDNEWLQSLFAIQEQWAPIYFKGSFWAGMSSTQRSEGMNNFFKSFFNPKTTLTDFAQQFNVALARRVEAEAIETFKMNDASIVPRSSFDIELVFSKVYTRLKLEEFQEELDNVAYQVDTFDEEVDGVHHYLVEDSSKYCKWNSAHGMGFIVKFRPTTGDIKCQCRKFEFTGILCRHIVKIWERNYVRDVPEKYIISRWRLDVPRNYLKYKIPEYNDEAAGPEPAAYAKLRDKFEDLAVSVMGKPTLAAELENFMNGLKVKAKTMAEDQVEGVEIVNHGDGVGRVFRRTVCDLPMPTMKSQPKATGSQSTASNGELVIKDPLVKVGPGRPRLSRIKPGQGVKLKNEPSKSNQKNQKRKSTVFDAMAPVADSTQQSFPILESSQRGSSYNGDAEPSTSNYQVMESQNSGPYQPSSQNNGNNRFWERGY